MNQRRLSLALALVAAQLACLVGCADTEEDGSGAGLSRAEIRQASEHLAGRYAHWDVVAYGATDMKTLIISFGFTDLAYEGGQLVATESFCHADNRSSQPITIEISDAATMAIRPRSVPVMLRKEGEQYGFIRPETPTGIGIHLEDPANEPLPDDPTDPRIADDDHDGNPGVTVHIKVTESFQGDLFIARREIFAYDVWEQADGSLTGTVSDHSEQLLIGATHPVFLMAGDWTQHPDLSKSPIILKRVGADWDCARLAEERGTLFPPAPGFDW